ncbi:MAG TPA: metallophosphoesterase, partial [Chlamydiales bacterium]|nr:metallophosphoesterase [Chlamydiales bacterium]
MALHLSHLKTSPHFIERLWDLWCVASIIGIWPRFIEPRLLFTTEKTLAIPTLAAELSGLKLLHISDLHYSSYTSRNFLERILARIQQLQPDLIVFTGDCITYAELEDEALLKEFLTQLSLVAPLGTYAVLGNHDYSDYVSLGDDGTYRLIQEHVPPLLKGLYRLISAKKTSQDPEIQS